MPYLIAFGFFVAFVTGSFVGIVLHWSYLIDNVELARKVLDKAKVHEAYVNAIKKLT
jgi:hypothetical protein